MENWSWYLTRVLIKTVSKVREIFLDDCFESVIFCLSLLQNVCLQTSPLQILNTTITLRCASSDLSKQ